MWIYNPPIGWWGWGQVNTIGAWTNINVDNTDPINPVVSVSLWADENFVTNTELTAIWTISSKWDMFLGNVQTVTAEKIYDKDKLSMKGTSTGKNIISVANTSATDYTNTLPAKNWTIAMTSDITGTNSNTNTWDNATNTTSNSYADEKVSDTAYDATSWDWVTTIAPSKNAVRDKIDAMDTTIGTKQETLVSGTNIKTINGTTILGSGDLEIAAWSGGYAANIYLTTLTSAVVWTYKQVSYTPEATETLISGTANNNTVLIQSYVFDLPLDVTTIDAGTWEFHPTLYVDSAVWDTRLIFEMYSRTTGWTETLLFTATSQEVNNTTRATITMQSIQSAFSVNATDYFVTKVYVSTTSLTNKTLTYVVWDGEATYFLTPLALRHSQLRARDLADSHPASAITNTPAGNIASTTVQAAINELDTEKAKLAWDITQSFGASTIELGHASDTTLSRVSAGVVAIEWNNILTANVWDTSKLPLAWWTLTGALAIEHASWLILWKDETGWTPNIAWTLKMISAWDNAFYNTFTSWTNTANATYTLPVAMPAVTGYVLSSTDAGVMSWIEWWWAWLAWNATIAWTSWTWLWITVSNSASAGAIWQSITIGNTQTNGVIWLNIDTGISTISTNSWIFIKHLIWYSGNNAGAIVINQFSSAIQPTSNCSFITMWNNFNTNSAIEVNHIDIELENNSSTGRSTWIKILNRQTTMINSTAWECWILLQQAWVGWTAMNIYGLDNINSSTYWLVNYILSNTQSWATVMQKIDLGTSAQTHTGLLVNAYNASNVNWVQVAFSTTWGGIAFSTTWRGASTSTNPLFLANWFSRTWTLNQATGNGAAFCAYWDAAVPTNIIWFYSSLNNAVQWWTHYSYVSAFQDNVKSFYVTDGATNPATKNYQAFVANLSSLENQLNTNYNKTSNVFELNLTRNNWRTATTSFANNFNLASLKRTTITSQATVTQTEAGSVLKLENVATQTAGTLTDTVTPLLIVQSANSTWVPLKITQNAVVSTNFKKLIEAGGITIWMSDWTTAEWALSWTEWDICLNGGTGAGQTAYCDATWTNWTDM